MIKLIKTIKSLFSAKTRKLNRMLQVSNCIDLVKEHQVSLAQAYKKLVASINSLEEKLSTMKSDVAKENNPAVKEIKEKNLSLVSSTIDRLKKNKEDIANKLRKSEDSKDILIAKKSLLDSIESLKSMSSNVFENNEFDIDSIMAEIDKTICDIESEFQANDELNNLVK